MKNETKKIHLCIAQEATLASLQEAFQQQFPYLKLEFYSKPHYSGIPSNRIFRLPQTLRIGDVRVKNAVGHFELNGAQTTADFEQLMQQVYDLNVQVFRRAIAAGRRKRLAWQQTWATDFWTLNKQNKQGEATAHRLNKPFEGAIS